MAPERVTNRDLYLAINALRIEVNQNISSLEVKVDENTTFRNQLTGKLAVMVGIIGLAINFLWDAIVNR